MASRSMKSNNPNIADRSDINRPAETAERFSEHYDNDKVDASKKASRSMKSNNPNIADRSDINRQAEIAERFSEHYDNDKMDASKKASRSMKSNNPNIADLSDVNRPTKTAERFSELYDNEWTEAYEEIGKKLKEKQIIQFLLEIVQEAYSYNLTESNKQIEGFEECALGILKTGKVGGSQSNTSADASQKVKRDTNLLVQYRKGIAECALNRLMKAFISDELKKLCKIHGRHTDLTPGEKTKAFATKCVELTWWMCVQDPPIHMVSDDGKTDFDANLYKAYTKSGRSIDFIVWPALQLYKKGPTLAKGVMQCK